MSTKDGVAMSQVVRRSLDIATTVATECVRFVWNDGGQGTSRRNAWSAMVADSQRARERATAEASLAVAAAPAPAVAAAR